MIIKLALIAIKRLPAKLEPQEEQLEQAGQVVHLSRPENGQKLKTPIRLIK